MSEFTAATTQNYLVNDARDRALEQGITALSEVDLLALLLRGAGERAPHNKAVALLTTFKSLRRLLTATKSEVSSVGLTDAQYVLLQASMEITRRHYRELMMTGTALSNPRATREYVRMWIRDLPHEVFGLIYLDNRHRVIDSEHMFRGTIDGASVHPREVVKTALAKNAAAVICYHNHPSGVAEPSQADELITRRLKEALSFVDIRLLDHLVVGDCSCESFAERGLL